MKRTSLYLEEMLNVKFPNEIAALIDSIAAMIHFPCNHTPVHEGDTTSCVYAIVTGIVRGYYIDNVGNDITKCFSVEGEFFSTEGFRSADDSSFTIECVEDCNCIRLPYDFLRILMDKSDEFKTLVNTLYESELGRLERRSQSLLIKDAEERYKEFIHAYPNLIDRVPLKHIASYIGIRAASLSRIRKKLKIS